MENESGLFFKFHRTMMIYSGLWNPKDFPKRKRLAYEFYSRIREVIAAWFILSRVLAGILFLVERNWEALMNNLLISLALMSLPLKYILCRSEEMFYILAEANRLQYNWSYASRSAEKIYNFYKKQSFKLCLSYVIFTSICTVLITSSTVIVAGIKSRQGETNADILLFSKWTPYDNKEHPFIAYGLDLVGVVYIAGFHSVADLLLFGLFSFGIANFKVFQSNLRNAKKYIEGIQKANGITFREAEVIFIEDNIIHHRNAIRFLKNVDKRSSTFIIFDFCSIAIKLSILIYQTLNELTMFFEYVALSTLISTITFELFAYYWYGNEIQLQSGELTRQAIFDSDFHEFSPETRKRLAFMIQRAQTPSQISIGPLYVMNIDTLIKILKMVYTYICLFDKVNEGKKNNNN